MNYRTLFVFLVGSALLLGLLISRTKDLRPDDNLAILRVKRRIEENSYPRLTREKRRELVYESIEAMLAALSDRYANFIRPKDQEIARTNLSGELTGIGVSFALEDGYPVILKVYPETPAWKAGLEKSWRIVKVHKPDKRGSEDVLDMRDRNLDEIRDLIKGPVGTSVKLTVRRPDGSETQKNVRREKIVLSSVTGFSWDGARWEKIVDAERGIGYLKIHEFQDNTYRQMKARLGELRKKNVSVLILDLRNNPGGHLAVCHKIIDLFVRRPGVDLVTVRTGSGKIDSLYKSTTEFAGIEKTVVLVNHASASASEVTASALRGLGLAVLVGERTFGKGAVLNYEEIKFGDGRSGSYTYTFAVWETPGARYNVEGVGLYPDVTYRSNARLEGPLQYFREGYHLTPSHTLVGHIRIDPGLIRDRAYEKALELARLMVDFDLSPEMIRAGAFLTQGFAPDAYDLDM